MADDVATADEATGAVDVASADAVAGWAHVLSTYVTSDGGFRYTALLASDADRALLDAYLAFTADPARDALTGPERLAFLINAYNAYTVKSMLDLWPVESVLREDGFFDGRTHTVAGTAMTLNDLENVHIRAAFGEPRIHLLVNCASAGCPWLIADVITAANLEEKLEAQTRSFIQRTTVADAAAGTLSASQIFEWFAGDFEAAGGVRVFLARYLDGDARALAERDTTRVTHFEYDWATNAR